MLGLEALKGVVGGVRDFNEVELLVIKVIRF